MYLCYTFTYLLRPIQAAHVIIIIHFFALSARQAPVQGATEKHFRQSISHTTPCGIRLIVLKERQAGHQMWNRQNFPKVEGNDTLQRSVPGLLICLLFEYFASINSNAVSRLSFVKPTGDISFSITWFESTTSLQANSWRSSSIKWGTAGPIIKRNFFISQCQCKWGTHSIVCQGKGSFRINRCWLNI